MFINKKFLVDIEGLVIDRDTKMKMKSLYEAWTKRNAYSILKTKVEIYSQYLKINLSLYSNCIIIT